LVRRLFVGQLLVILVGAATLGVVAFLVAPPIFHDHIRRAVGPISDVVAHHLDRALSETLTLALLLGILAATAAATAVSWLLATRIARPVEQLSRTAGALADGRLAARAPRPAGDDELADLTDAFNDMADAIEHTEDTRRRLLADLAHELRTPLATIEAYHEGLADGVVRAEEGQLALELAPLEVRAIVRAAVDAIAPDAREREVELRLRLPDCRLTVTGDRDRLTQVLSNLMRNALEHTPEGGSITVSAEQGGDEVSIEVSDTGAGIAAEHLPQVFERFFRADPARRHVAGSGIGLTISRAIVQGHGGTITVHSDGPGRGATFTVRLPRGGNYRTRRPGTSAR
jgi:two-component system, OmpR family, sensor histidine kinase BaeS